METLNSSIFSVNNELILFYNYYTDLFAIYIESLSYGYSILWLDLLSIFTLIAGIFVIITRNPVISVLNLIALFIIISGYLFLIGLNFLALSYILVYIGAVSILFIFVLMLINIRLSELHSYTRNSLLLGILVGIPLYFSVDSRIPNNETNQEFLYSLLNWFNPNTIVKLFHTSLSTSDKWDGNFLPQSEISSIGNIIYSSHSMWVLVISVILLLAMVGTIVMTVNPSFKNSKSTLRNFIRSITTTTTTVAITSFIVVLAMSALVTSGYLLSQLWTESTVSGQIQEVNVLQARLNNIYSEHMDRHQHLRNLLEQYLSRMCARDLPLISYELLSYRNQFRTIEKMIIVLTLNVPYAEIENINQNIDSLLQSIRQTYPNYILNQGYNALQFQRVLNDIRFTIGGISSILDLNLPGDYIDTISRGTS